jgi:hypothetical protein
MDKERCDLCGKEVGSASMYRRIGFVAGARTQKVCGSCHSDKLQREERLRFAKSAGKAKKKAMEDWKPDYPTPPDELRFGPG